MQRKGGKVYEKATTQTMSLCSVCHRENATEQLCRCTRRYHAACVPAAINRMLVRDYEENGEDAWLQACFLVCDGCHDIMQHSMVCDRTGLAACMWFPTVLGVCCSVTLAVSEPTNGYLYWAIPIGVFNALTLYGMLMVLDMSVKINFAASGVVLWWVLRAFILPMWVVVGLQIGVARVHVPLIADGTAFVVALLCSLRIIYYKPYVYAAQRPTTRDMYKRYFLGTPLPVDDADVHQMEGVVLDTGFQVPEGVMDQLPHTHVCSIVTGRVFCSQSQCN